MGWSNKSKQRREALSSGNRQPLLMRQPKQTTQDTMKTEAEIQEMADRAVDAPAKFSGMSYEEGVRSALDWVLGNLGDGETPLD